MTIKFNPRQQSLSLVAMLGLGLLSGAILPSLLLGGRTSNLDMSEGLLGFQLALASVYALAGLLLLIYLWWRPIVPILKIAAWPLAFLILVIASLSWSIEPLLSLRRAIALAGTLSFVVFLAVILGYERSIRVLAWTLLLTALASLIFAVAIPQLGTHTGGAHMASWKGAFLHKNLLGREMALAGGIFAVLASLSPQKHRWFWLSAVFLATLLVLMAGSATGILALVSCLSVVMILYATFRQPWFRAAAISTVMLLTILLTLLLNTNPEGVFGALERDASLTGRTYLWAIVVDRIAERPWFGYGYRAFWASSKGEEISRQLDWTVRHGHNAGLDLVLSLGIVGALIMLVILLRPWLFILSKQHHLNPLMSRFGAVILVNALIISMSDSILQGPNNLIFALLMYQCIAVGLVFKQVPH